MKKTSTHIDIIDVGPRDGLQSLPPLSMAVRTQWIEHLIQSGIKHIEIGAMVSPTQLPSMRESAGISTYFHQQPLASDLTLSLLVPNLQGCIAALETGIKHISVFTAASDSFCQKNTHCSINESLERLHPVVEQAKNQGVAVRGYLSCIVDCPYEGAISPAKSGQIANELFAMGCDEISIGDTLGKAAPKQIEAVLSETLTHIPATAIAGHYHNTYGMALANVMASYALGIRRFDTSSAGLGGCPYAPGASGNLATEELLWLCERQQWSTDINLPQLREGNREWCQVNGITPDSRL